MTRRELERWVLEHREALATKGVDVFFGFGPSLVRRDGSTWASFTSRCGSGRFIRTTDGSSSVDVYSYEDGSCLRRERHSDAPAEELTLIAELLTPLARGTQMISPHP